MLLQQSTYCLLLYHCICLHILYFIFHIFFFFIPSHGYFVQQKFIQRRIIPPGNRFRITSGEVIHMFRLSPVGISLFRRWRRPVRRSSTSVWLTSASCLQSFLGSTLVVGLRCVVLCRSVDSTSSGVLLFLACCSVGMRRLSSCWSS